MTRTDLINDALEVIQNPVHAPRDIKLYYCKARIIKADFTDLIPLISYNTCVAAYSFELDAIFQFDYYSSTTCQHIHKFRKWLHENYYDVNAHIVHLYKDSGTTKKQDRINRENDYSNIIKLFEIQ